MGKTKAVCIDLFSGAGGLSEGFIKNGFNVIAHVEMNREACLTLKTRLAFHYLSGQKRISEYQDYITGKISRNELYSRVPKKLLDGVLNYKISKETFGEITDIIDSRLQGRKVDVIFGGPPCQAYSLIGRARDENSMRTDSRKYLYQDYIAFLEKYNPKYFLFENVKGLLSSEDELGIKIITRMKNEFRKAGFDFQYKVLNALDFGVSQNRERLIIFGYRSDSEVHNFPEFQKIPHVPLKEILKDLPPLKHGEHKNEYLYNQTISNIRNIDDVLTWHVTRANNENDLEIYQIAAALMAKGQRLRYQDLPDRLITHKNVRTFTDRFKVVDWSSISHTLVAHIAKDGHYYIHPDIKQNRSISVREAARIQGFPDNYFFETSRTSAYKQIGNAVPPIMAYQLSNKILRMVH